MLDMYKRQIISQIINDNGYIISFHDVKRYINWLKIYTKNLNLIKAIKESGEPMGIVTANFIMHYKKESTVINFTKKILLRLIDIDNKRLYNYSEEINTLEKIIHPITDNIFPTKNLIYIKKQTNNIPINNEINNLFVNFKNISNLNKRNKKNELHGMYKNIIQYSELLLLSTFNYILSQHKKDIPNSIISREKSVYKILHIQNSKEKLNKIANIQERNYKKSQRGLNDILKGLSILANKFLKGTNISNGIDEITKGLELLRSTTSAARTETVSPTLEETILSLGISSTLSRFLIYKSKKI